jgi:hypothetical protein
VSQLNFTKATKKQARARIAFEGPSGSGKTYTALITARALGKRIALIDTEHRSASLYADEFDFDTLPLDRYDPQVLIEALAVAAASGYDVVIVDSLSHFWMGTDGMLEQVDKAAKRSAGGNTFGGWKDMAPLERKMIEAMLAFPGHVIATMRQKTEWVIEENDRGKKVPRKIGLKAVQRDGLEYEFTIVGDLNHENELVVSKSRCKTAGRRCDPQAGRGVRPHDPGLARGRRGHRTVTAAELRGEALRPAYATRADLLALYQRAQKHRPARRPGRGRPRATATTLGELIAAKGKAAAARPVSAPPGRCAAADTGEAADQPPSSSPKLHAMLAKAGIDRPRRQARVRQRPAASRPAGRPPPKDLPKPETRRPCSRP